MKTCRWTAPRRDDGRRDRRPDDLQCRGQRHDRRRNGDRLDSAGVASDGAGNLNGASTSTDNTVTYQFNVSRRRPSRTASDRQAGDRFGHIQPRRSGRRSSDVHPSIEQQHRVDPNANIGVGIGATRTVTVIMLDKKSGPRR
jgi:hypothetical protein